MWQLTSFGFPPQRIYHAGCIPAVKKGVKQWLCIMCAKAMPGVSAPRTLPKLVGALAALDVHNIFSLSLVPVEEVSFPDREHFCQSDRAISSQNASGGAAGENRFL
jgi:hypothetical protein